MESSLAMAAGGRPRVFDLTARALGPWRAPTFAGPLLRSALGAACAARACAPGCEGARHVPDCGFEPAFHGRNGGAAPFRIDGSGLDGRRLREGEPWVSRLVVFAPGSVELLLDAWALALDRGLGRERSRHALLDTREATPAPGAGGPCRVVLASPTLLVRDGRPVARPGLLDVLHATRQRARTLGLEVRLPRFEDQLDISSEELSRSPVPWEGGALPAWTATWRLVATPAQAEWFSLAAVTGVGKHTAYGMGAVRVESMWRLGGEGRGV